MTINEFFQFPTGKSSVKAFDDYKEKCKRDFNNLYSDEDWKKYFKF